MWLTQSYIYIHYHFFLSNDQSYDESNSYWGKIWGLSIGKAFILSGIGFQKVGFTVEFDSFNLNFFKSKP